MNDLVRKLAVTEYVPTDWDGQPMEKEKAFTIPFCGIGFSRVGKTRSYKLVHFKTGSPLLSGIDGKSEAEYLFRRIVGWANWLDVTKANCHQLVPNFRNRITDLREEYRRSTVCTCAAYGSSSCVPCSKAKVHS